MNEFYFIWNCHKTLKLVRTYIKKYGTNTNKYMHIAHTHAQIIRMQISKIRLINKHI